MTEETRSLLTPERRPLAAAPRTRTRAKPLTRTRRTTPSSTVEATWLADGASSAVIDALRSALPEGGVTTAPPTHPASRWADLLQLSALLDDQCSTLSETADDRAVHEALRAALDDVAEIVASPDEESEGTDLTERAIGALVATLRRWL